MKTALKKKAGAFFSLALLTIFSAMFQTGCGKPEDPSANPLGAQGAGGRFPMKGFAGFGSQCLSGYNTDPKAVKLALWSCPLTNLPMMELAEPLKPLMFSADCARKTLTIRSMDHAIDTMWEVMPDGSFYITLDGLDAKLKADGSGNFDCKTPLSADLWGKIECGTRPEQAKIRFETVMWLNKKTVPAAFPTGGPVNPNLPPAATAQPAAKVCQLPEAKCYFHAIHSINQCP